MIEVFKTNVTERMAAITLVAAIHNSFDKYEANFDLHDCDNILRIKSVSGFVDSDRIIELVQHFGYSAEVLPDEVPVLVT
jgi:hypothetical protein